MTPNATGPRAGIRVDTGPVAGYRAAATGPTPGIQARTAGERRCVRCQLPFARAPVCGQPWPGPERLTPAPGTLTGALHRQSSTRLSGDSPVITAPSSPALLSGTVL